MQEKKIQGGIMNGVKMLVCRPGNAISGRRSRRQEDASGSIWIIVQ